MEIPATICSKWWVLWRHQVCIVVPWKLEPQLHKSNGSPKRRKCRVKEVDVTSEIRVICIFCGKIALYSDWIPQVGMASQSWLALVGTASLFRVAICQASKYMRVPSSTFSRSGCTLGATMCHASMPSHAIRLSFCARLSPGYAIEIPKKAGRVRSISMLT